LKKPLGQYEITSKEVRVIVHAHDKKEAWRQFFAEVRKNGWAGRIGMLALMKAPGWKSQDDSIGMRTFPTLWNMKLVDWDTLVSSLAIHLNCSEQEAGLIMSDAVKKDAWAVPAEAFRGIRP